jgi:hypothetical protein
MPERMEQKFMTNMAIKINSFPFSCNRICSVTTRLSCFRSYTQINPHILYKIQIVQSAVFSRANLFRSRGIKEIVRFCPGNSHISLTTQKTLFTIAQEGAISLFPSLYIGVINEN